MELSPLTLYLLSHWGWVTHICISKQTIIGSDNGLSHARRQVIIWTNAGILSIRTLGTNFSEILREIHIFSFKNIHLKMLSGKRRPFCLGLNVLKAFTIWKTQGTPGAIYILVFGIIEQVKIKEHWMACRLHGAKPLSEQMLGYCKLDP